MNTPADRAKQAVGEILRMTIHHLNDLAEQAHESSTRALAAETSEQIARIFSAVTFTVVEGGK